MDASCRRGPCVTSAAGRFWRACAGATCLTLEVRRGTTARVGDRLAALVEYASMSGAKRLLLALLLSGCSVRSVRCPPDEDRNVRCPPASPANVTVTSGGSLAVGGTIGGNK